MLGGDAARINLVDIDRERAEGEAADLAHSAPMIGPTIVRAVDIEACGRSQVVIIAAGANQRPGESRMDLAGRNADRVSSIMEQLDRVCPDAVVIIVSNPVDVLTYVAVQRSSRPAGRILGSGTVLDSVRLRQKRGACLGTDPRNMHGYVLGEHGDSEFVAWSQVFAGAVPARRWSEVFDRSLDHDFFIRIEDEVRGAAYEIIKRKKATYYGVAACISRIVRTIVRDQSSIMPVSTLLQGALGLDDVCLSLPSVVNRGGVSKVLRLELTDEEHGKARHSADCVRRVIDSVRIQPA
jgi:L-lactate dehydrogenase